ncbi:DUF3995 domain-containing protein [Leptospira kmetyi]|uniref:DUF3995 domain-containing protein n=1 Tax=Leptospira kmetyi TaxID=408139 RepID=UPI000288A663|nr:DUF3995 domain-containing protein [Leptospira kmetyi]EQA54521.1 PF13160 family protein [Leptospira kmetyi serovar Malaysia str. Bejo-Iso9]
MEPIAQITSWISGTILFVLSGLHFYWVAGGTKGKNRAIPEVQGKPAFQPGKLTTATVGILLFLAVLFPIGLRMQAPFGIFRNLLEYGTVFLSFVFLLRAIGDFKLVGFFKRIRGTDFAKYDDLYYSPLCLILSLLLFVSRF